MPEKITIYTMRSCPHCARAKDLLRRKKLAFDEVDVTDDMEKRDELEKKTGWMTVPMIFFGDEFLGGADDLDKLAASGDLDARVK